MQVKHLAHSRGTPSAQTSVVVMVTPGFILFLYTDTDASPAMRPRVVLRSHEAAGSVLCYWSPEVSPTWGLSAESASD